MAEFILATASTLDLPAEYMREHDIPFIRYPYAIGGEERLDDCEDATQSEVYRRMRAGELPNTSLINEFVYFEYLDKLMAQGKDVMFLDMSRQMSASFTHALAATEKIQEKYKDAKNRLYTMDTVCVSGGLGLLVHYIRKLRDEGKTMDEAIEWGEANKRNMIHWFTVDDLSFLKRTGRVSNAAAMFGTLLNVKPVLYVDNEGHLMAESKVRGRKKALLTILEHMKEDFTDPDGKEVLINHADCLADAEFMRDKVKETFPTVGKITIANLGTIIGIHCGPGLFTIFYYGNKRYK